VTGRHGAPKAVGALRLEMARALAAAFAVRGYEGTPALDARLLVAHLLRLSPEAVPLHDEDAVSAGMVAEAAAIAKRRGEGEPVARIVGVREFHGLMFQLSADTLVPRPDTETVVDAALAAIDLRGPRDGPLTILDLGTGSGAILLALLAALPRATGVGVDLAAGAIATARANAGRLGLAAQAEFVQSDWASAIDARFDIVVANPPYIESGTIDTLAVEVSRFDPHVALDGGLDGLRAIRAIAADLGRVLAESGAAFVEIGAGQGPAVREIAAAHDFSARMVNDLTGMERVAVLERTASAAAGGAQPGMKIALGNQSRTS
jgi:release factor glutamine methyltransferase